MDNQTPSYCASGCGCTPGHPGGHEGGCRWITNPLYTAGYDDGHSFGLSIGDTLARVDCRQLVDAELDRLIENMKQEGMIDRDIGFAQFVQRYVHDILKTPNPLTRS